MRTTTAFRPICDSLMSLSPVPLPISHRRSARYKIIRRTGLLLGWVLLSVQVPTESSGQVVSAKDTVSLSGSAWHLFVDGSEATWPLEGTAPIDSLQSVARHLLDRLHGQGYLLARMDSARVDTSFVPAVAQLYVTAGEQANVRAVHLRGMTALDSLDVGNDLETQAGRPFDPRILEKDLETLLSAYERAGYPLASARIEELDVRGAEQPLVSLLIDVTEGPVLVLHGVALIGATRTRARYVARLADLRVGQVLRNYDPEVIQQQLDATGFFRSVEFPELVVYADTGVVVRIPVEEDPPGTFDLVLGYQPSAGGSGRGSFVGNGHLNLVNLFGMGREFSLRLNRLPGQVSSADVRAVDPFVWGLPVRVEARFSGIQQDSTYNKQQYGLEVGLRLGAGLHVYTSLSREATRPGQHGVSLLADGTQRVAQAAALFVGIGMRYERLDRRVNPRRGILFDTNFERGRKERTARIALAGQDTTTEKSLLRQQRLHAGLRIYLPTWIRQVAVVGGEAHVLVSDAYDLSDLFRFGGAASLRGYDEERFYVPVASRIFLEYRYLLDRTSYGFLFLDLGYVERNARAGFDALRGFYPGYGIGFQIGTEVGLITLSLAANPEEATGIRAHLGLSFGL